MTITLALRDNEKIDVKAYLPFERYGYTFAVHKSQENINLWNVSEVSTGFAVCYNHRKIQDAIKTAKGMLKKAGKKGVIEAVEYAKELLKG